MNIKLLITFVLIFILVALGCSNAPAQKRMTDRELEGLKGLVKSVITEVEYLNPKGASFNQPREKQDEYYFDKEGNVTKVVFPQLNGQEIFSVVDGFKTYQNERINEEPKANKRVVVINSDEKPGNKTSPDNRYNVKFTYEYDTQGRVKIEEQYFNDGKLFQKTEFRYDEKGKLKEQIADNTSDITIYTFKYDEKGNLMEKSEDSKVKKYGSDRNIKTVYSDSKIDSKGNWTQRIETSYIKENGESFIAKSIVYKTTTYY